MAAPRSLIVAAALAAGVGAARADERTARDALDRELARLFVPGGLTAASAAARAAKIAPEVRRRSAELEAAEAELSRAWVALVPVIGGQASYVRLSPLDPVVLPLGEERFVIPFREASLGASAQVSLPLSDLAVRIPSGIAGARRARDAAREAERAGARAVAQRAREVFYEWLRARLRVLVARRQLRQVESTLEQLEALADVQRVSRADQRRVESQRAQAAQALDQLVDVAAWRAEQLRLLIGAADGEELAVGEDVRAELPAPGRSLDLDGLTRRALTARPEVAGLELAREARRAQSRSEAAAMAPRLSAFATVDYANPNPRVFPQEDRLRMTWTAGARLSWTLSDSLLAGAARRGRVAEADALAADARELRDKVRLEVLAAAQAVRLARRAIEVSREGVAAAEEAYRVRKDLFSVGRATVVEMIDAESELTRARVAALDARIDVRLAAARLAHVLGEPSAR